MIFNFKDNLKNIQILYNKSANKDKFIEKLHKLKDEIHQNNELNKQIENYILLLFFLNPFFFFSTLFGIIGISCISMINLKKKSKTFENISFFCFFLLGVYILFLPIFFMMHDINYKAFTYIYLCVVFILIIFSVIENIKINYNNKGKEYIYYNLYFLASIILINILPYILFFIKFITTGKI